MSAKPVLIVGAGPTGLVLALWLSRRGVAFDIIDEKEGPGEGSRALAVHARTLEFYRQLGIADEIIAAGRPLEALYLHRAGREKPLASLDLHNIGNGLGPYPFVLSLAQDRHEEILARLLSQGGHDVQWRTRFEDYEDTGLTALAKMTTQDSSPRTVEYRWICGCDGAHSRIRESMGTSLAGGTYSQLFYVADIAPRQRPPEGFHVALGSRDFTIMLPIGSGATRLIGLMPENAGNADGFDAVSDAAQKAVGIEVGKLNWFSTYRVHHRVAGAFRKGRAFLLGDAGHIHSPAGGQGMNTGIGDAVNLGWKLAAVERQHAPEQLLDTYAAERLPFARQLVETTDKAFSAIVRRGPIGEVTRRLLAPAALRLVSSFRPTRRKLFERISQIRIRYRDSPLSQGGGGDLIPGDRLPWTGFAGPDNYKPLSSLDWQVHEYCNPDLAQTLSVEALPVHRFTWHPEMQKAGIHRNSRVLVRPDGHIAAISTAATQTFVSVWPPEWSREECHDAS